VARQPRAPGRRHRDGRANKSFAEKLKSPSLLDQMELTYVKGPRAA
jgi:hypothetical protein